MEMVIKLPSDLRSLPQFRALKASLGEARAMLCWFVLFQELHYRAIDGGIPGRLPRSESALMFSEVAAAVEMDSEALQTLMTSSGLLKADGDDWICPRFMVLNGRPQSGRSAASLGGDMRAFSLKMKGLDNGGAVQQALVISEQKWVDEEGKPLDRDAIKRMTRLIVGCDNALRKGERPPMMFTDGLLADALRIIRKHTDEEVDHMLREVVRHRNHPLMNTTTEKLLPDLAAKVGEVQTSV